MGVVVRRYIDFLILLIPTPSICSFYSNIPTFVHLKKCCFFRSLNSNLKSECNLKIPLLLYTRWLVCVVCINYMCVIRNTDVGRVLKYSTLLLMNT